MSKKNNFKEIVDFLEKHRVTFMQCCCDESLNNSLHFAAENENVNLVEYLLNKGANLDS